MKYPLLAPAIALLLLTASVPADVVKIPEKDPVASVDVPADWKPEATDKGVATESPDKVATVFFEASTEDGLEALIEENVEWLVKEQAVKIDRATKKKADFENAGRQWNKISWSADSKEWGPAVVGFMFTKVGKGKVLTITYWITNKDREKHDAVLAKMLDSVKAID
jgi:hypothetical protein